MSAPSREEVWDKMNRNFLPTLADLDVLAENARDVAAKLREISRSECISLAELGERCSALADQLDPQP